MRLGAESQQESQTHQESCRAFHNTYGYSAVNVPEKAM